MKLTWRTPVGLLIGYLGTLAATTVAGVWGYWTFIAGTAALLIVVFVQRVRARG